MRMDTMKRISWSLKFLLFFCLIASGLTGAFGLKTEAADWPQWRGINRDSISDETGWIPEALRKKKIVWKTRVGIGYSAAAVKDKYLYTMGNKNNTDTVFCLDAETGKEIWSYSYPCSLGEHPGPRATPTIDGEQVFTLSREGHLYCFNVKNGKVRWKRNITKDFGVAPPIWGYAGSPVVEGDLLLLNAGVSGIALNKKSGKEIWVSKRGTGGYATPVIYDWEGKRHAAIFGQKALYGVSVETGEVLWSYPWQTDWDVNAADPVVVGNRVFISSGYGKGCALLEISAKGKPKVVWKNTKLRSHFSSFVYLDGYLYGNDGQSYSSKNNLRCLDFETGREMWGAELGFGSLISVDGKLIFLNERGDLFIAEATHSSYQEISRAKGVLSRICWTPPVFWNGGIICRNDQGDMIYIDMKK
jgi:outer membrane protein assembly factor BamB